MDKNTGERIISLANVLFGLAIVISIIMGLVTIATLSITGSAGVGIIAGFLYIGFGCFFAWVARLVLTGVGEGISNTFELLAMARKNAYSVEQLTKSGVSNASSASRTSASSGNFGSSTALPYNSQQAAQSAQPSANAEINSLMRYAALLLEDGDWEKANGAYDRVLSAEPENAMAYIGKLCVELHIKHENELLDYNSPITEFGNYKRALQFADNNYRKSLINYATTPAQRNDQQQGIFGRINEAKLLKDMNVIKALASEISQMNDQDRTQVVHAIGYPSAVNEYEVACPLCGEKQRSGRRLCFICGIPFISPGE